MFIPSSVHAEPEQGRQILAPSLSRCQVERTENQPLSQPFSSQRIGEPLTIFCPGQAARTGQFI